MDQSLLAELWPVFATMLALLVGSAFFSGSETALFSLSRGQRERLGKSERASDRRITRVLADPRKLLITLLLGNELINITFSSLSALVMDRLAGDMHVVAVTFVTAAVTVPLLLLFGEITPKSIAIRTPERWSWFTAPVLLAFSFVSTPIRWVVQMISAGIVKLLGGHSPSKAPPRVLTEEDLRALVDVGAGEGVLRAGERRIIHKVFEFGDRRVAEIMTPRETIFSLPFELPLARLAQEVAASGYSRVPVYRGRRRDIVGILFAKDLVATSLAEGKTIKSMLRPAMYVPRTTKCDRLLREFQKRRSHFALVVDEYGRNVGLVTMEDLLEEIFGEFYDEKEVVPGADGPEPLVEPVKGRPS